MAEWQPIETAPKDGSAVIVSTDYRAVGEAYYEEHDQTWYWSGNHWTDAHDGTVRYPIAWQPLPEPAPTGAKP